ncbi:MAG: YlmC/YmxH family sporulation protein [Oscillospiraceae bacterium]|nr:YlmC/YmxH family sporulation protein [Oscillospiraceae bacterium]
MICRFDDLRCKEIINIKNGSKLGYPDDIEFDTCTAKICKIIVYGKSKLFGLFGREEDFVIPWCDIEIIGCDTILVTCDFPPRTKKSGGFMKNLLK